MSAHNTGPGEAPPERSAEYVRVGTWLLPEGYGADYDHFTMTQADTQPGICIAVYAKVEDIRGTRYEEQLLRHNDSPEKTR